MGFSFEKVGLTLHSGFPELHCLTAHCLSGTERSAWCWALEGSCRSRRDVVSK